MSGIFIHAFSHLKDKPKADRALLMLQRIASLVKPIMKKHSWNLPVLAEFFPDSPNLLGLNINLGQKICLRLRPAQAPDTFLDEEDVVQTMLHELAHNIHGPHDEKFYKFLSELQDEYEVLRQSGYAGEGFFSEGCRLGAGVSHDLPPHLARSKALAAAEKRKQTSRILGRSSRLGGKTNASSGLSPRDLAAQAAERRARDERMCGSGLLAEQEAAKAAKDSAEDRIIDLTSCDSDSDSDVIIIHQKPSNVTIPQQRRMVVSTASKENKPTTSNNITSDSFIENGLITHAKAIDKTPLQWLCLICTLINEPSTLRCDACYAERPPDPSVGWACLICGEVGMPHERWTCQFCGTIKATS